MVTTIRLPDDLHKALKAEAERKGITFNAYVLVILWKSVKGVKEGRRRGKIDKLLEQKEGGE